MVNSASPTQRSSGTAPLFRSIVESMLGRIAATASGDVAIKTHTVCDHESAHYLLVAEGWQGYRRVYRTLAHIALLGDGLHIYEDNTVEGIAELLYASGVPKERIVCEWVQPSVIDGSRHP